MNLLGSCRHDDHGDFCYHFFVLLLFFLEVLTEREKESLASSSPVILTAARAKAHLSGFLLSPRSVPFHSRSAMGDENADDDRGHGHGHGHGRPCQGKKTGGAGAGAASVLPLLVTSSSSSSFSSLPSSSTLSSSGTGVRTKTILVLVVLLVAIVQFGDVIRSAAPLVLSTPPALSSKKTTTFHPPSTTPIPPSSLSSGVDNDDDKDDARNGSPAGTTAFDSLVAPRNNNSSDAESAAAAQPPLEPSNGDTNEEAGGGAPSQPPSPTPASFHPTPLRQPLPSSPTKQQQHSTKAHLLQNQTFSNWTVLAHQLPVPSNSFRNVYPNGLRLAFIGDSLTRYQVLSLMYYLHNHGQKWQPDSEQPNLVTQKTKAYKNDWNIYFNITSHVLGEASGKHKCDCYRGVTDPARIFENRYFRDVKGNNYIYFLTKLGRAPSRGRWYVSFVQQRLCGLFVEPAKLRAVGGRALSLDVFSLLLTHPLPSNLPHTGGPAM